MAPPSAAKNRRQRQPITTTLRNICESYSASTTLREILQNADDAKATEIEYVLDTNTYTDTPLLHPELADYHGPALLARNNSLFTEDDLDSLSSVGDSGKRFDPVATGKFGQGFNSVYHWTDGPWVYSRNFLLILDPHERWSKEFEAGGPTWNVIQHQDNQEIQNHLKTFAAFGVSPGKELNETIIRIPLRTGSQAAVSKIVNRAATVPDIEQVLLRFIHDIEQGDLLFLKHIRKVIVRVNGSVLSTAQIVDDDPCTASIRDALPEDFLRLYNSSGSGDLGRISRIFETNIRFANAVSSWTDTYLVQHIFEPTSGDSQLDAWAKERKLFPWVAIAAPLPGRQRAFMGKLFSTLSLQVTTQEPLHIHGLFAIAPDRARLGFDERAIQWNTYMFRTCVAGAWIKLLEHRNSKSAVEEGFGLWPRADTKYKAEDIWTGVIGWLIEEVVHKQNAVWNSTNGTCVSLNDALFTAQNEDSARYQAAWTAIGLPGVVLEHSRLKMLQARLSINLPLLTPAAVRKHLHTNNVISCDVAANVLEYCLLDAISNEEPHEATSICGQLYGIRFWPMLNGELGAIAKSGKALLPRDDAEMQLFSRSRPSTTLKLDSFNPKVRQFMLNKAVYTNTIARSRSLKDLLVDWPIMYQPQGPVNDSAIVARRDEGQDALLRDIWTWICTKLTSHKDDMPRLMRTLWLLPINGSRIRRLALDTNVILTLVIEKGESLADLFCDPTARNVHANAALLDAGCVNGEVISFLKSAAVTIPDLRLAIQDHLATFAEWLIAANDIVQRLSESHKRLLLRHLAQMVENQQSRSCLAGKMRQLPLYAKSVGIEPYVHRTVQRCAIDRGQSSYELPDDLPSLPDLEGVSFYDLSDSAEKYIVQKLGLLQFITRDALLQFHLLPWLLNVSEASLTAAKAALVDWIMSNSLSSSEAWKELVRGHALIPMPSEGDTQAYRCLKDLIDPASPYTELYFEEEKMFPAREFFNKHRAALRICGIGNGADSPTLPLDRARAFARHVADDRLVQKARCLFGVSVCSNLPNEAIQEIRRLKWLPAESPIGKLQMFAPNQCRGMAQRPLVDLVWGITKLNLAHGWEELLGWNEDIPHEILLKQLDRCIEQRDGAKIDRLLLHFGCHDYSALAEKPCILGTHGTYMLPCKVFSPGNALKLVSMIPYIDRVDPSFAKRHATLLTKLAVRVEPTVFDLQNVQAAILSNTGRQLDSEGLPIAIASLEVATQLSYDPTQFLIPDTTMTLRRLADIVHGECVVSGEMAHFNFAHPSISVGLLRRLEVENAYQRAFRLNIEIEDEDEDEFTPREKLTTIICDTLGRYPIDTTFNEFLANADDAGAEKISWTIDNCPDGHFGALSLFTPELQSLQGPALIVYNDSDKDFTGFKEIGQGGKGDDATTTGMFGRGALTILDPQQERLSRNKQFKRKVGIKISLALTRRMASDQLTPFVGMHGYDKSLDYFNGTIFRFPFRKAAVKTDLRDSTELIDQKTTKELLDAYLITARLSLLFLHTVNSIEVCIRGTTRPQGLEDEVFRNVIISTSREDQKPTYDLWRIGLHDIESSPADLPKVGKGSSKLTECGIAACIQRNQTQKPGFESKPINSANSVKINGPHEQRVFCKLPTTSASSLPVSFHASFAITGDRKTVAFEGQDQFAIWNRHLLTECIADFYIDFLKDATPRYGESAFGLWPKTSLSGPPSLSSVISDSFWAKLMGAEHRYDQLYPLRDVDKAGEKTGQTNLKRQLARGRRVLYEATTVERAHFDFLPDAHSSELQPLFRRLAINLVRPPFDLRKYIRMAARDFPLVELGPDFLARLFKKDENCEILETYLNELETEAARSAFYRVFLLVITPSYDGVDTASLNILNGCRIIPRPRLNLRLGTLLLKPPQGTIDHLLADNTEQKLFSFAFDMMVHTQLFKPYDSISKPSLLPIRDPVQDILKGSWNVRELNLGDAGFLLSRKASPTKCLTSSHEHADWMTKLWDYLNTTYRASLKALEIGSEARSARNSTESLLTETKVWDQPIYKCIDVQPSEYVTPRTFISAAYIVRPDAESHQKLCASILGLKYVDRRCIPYFLAESESNLEQTAGFERFIRAIKRIEQATTTPTRIALDAVLTPETRTTLRKLLFNFLNKHQKHDSVPDVALLRCLPVWPRVKRPGQVLLRHYVPATEAYFCQHSAMMMPWIKDLTHFVDPTVVEAYDCILPRLGVQSMTVEGFWELMQRDLPPSLPDMKARLEHLRLLQHLAKYHIKTKTRIAPNGTGTLCKPDDLYDHDDPLFREAFRGDLERFVHPDLHSLRTFFVFNGLRARSPGGPVTSDDFVQCALAVDKRWSDGMPSAIYDGPAAAVANYLEYDIEAFHGWSESVWRQISRLHIFKVKKYVLDQPAYRQLKMQDIAEQCHCCILQDAAQLVDIRICWSQFPFLQHPPTDYVFKQRLGGSKPSLETVYKHVQYLVANWEEVSEQDLSEYLKDIQACYEHLQKYKASKDLPGIQDAPMWFNLESTTTDKIAKTQLKGNILPAKVLCLEAPCDTPSMKRTRKFLVPYERLLATLGCPAFVQPEALPPRDSIANGPFSLGTVMNELRRREELVDVFFEAEGNRLPAHKIVLAAVSDYCKAQFAGTWGQITQRGTVVPFEYGCKKLSTLSTMVDFAYGVAYTGPELMDKEDENEVADKLDEILDLLVCSDSWQMLRLRDQVEDYLTETSNATTYRRADNVEFVKDIAGKANAKRLVMHCENYMRMNRDGMERLKRA
ncbi:MAG: hypothetical protein Q9163_005063 [Psora crenata]